MGKIIAIASQKGGVGKTTTAINLSSCLALEGKRVLVIDSDPQASLTFGLGMRKNGSSIKGLYEVFIKKASLKEAMYNVINNLYLVPAKIDLFMAELEFFDTEERERMLKAVLDDIKKNLIIFL